MYFLSSGEMRINWSGDTETLQDFSASLIAGWTYYKFLLGINRCFRFKIIETPQFI